MKVKHPNSTMGWHVLNWHLKEVCTCGRTGNVCNAKGSLCSGLTESHSKGCCLATAAAKFCEEVCTKKARQGNVKLTVGLLLLRAEIKSLFILKRVMAFIQDTLILKTVFPYDR